ncbi:MAG: hypothetical protein ABIQ93_14760 [Saprospiraceae bacterium]
MRNTFVYCITSVCELQFYRFAIMTLYDRYQLLQRMDAFIRRRGTGSPDVFAQRLLISRSTLFRYLEDLSSFGASIAYDRDRESYYYTNESNFKF